MQFSILALLLLVIPFAVFANSVAYSEDDSDLTPSERFARDLELRKKFAFAFAKRSASSPADEVLIEARSATPKDMRFAFAKRRAAKEFARFARASFA